MTWREFLSMGNYGAYVWSAYGLTFAVLILNLVVPLRRRREVLHRLKQYLRGEAL
jgi:heme exporter protein D